MTDATPTIAEPDRHRWPAVVVLLIAVVVAAAMLWTNLGHASIKNLDESFHAVVARNLLTDPLRPMLYREPYLPQLANQWQFGHVWLHKPTLPMWQIAASFKLFGTNTLALRLPSLGLFLATGVLIFLTARRLTGTGPAAHWSAVVAAVVWLFLPAPWMLVYGYGFSDHIDVAIIFYLTLALYALVRAAQDRSTRCALVCGAAQALAYLCKSYPAFAITIVATLLWLLPQTLRFKHTPNRLSGRQLLWLLAATAVVAGPWSVYQLVQFPAEFERAQGHIFSHLDQDVEQWGAPWDRLLFDYHAQHLLRFYPVALAALVLAVRDAWRTRDAVRLTPVLFWFAYIVPHLFAVTKTPSQAMPAAVALLLALAQTIAVAWSRRDVMAGVTLVVGAALAAAWRPKFAAFGLDATADESFARFARANGWIVIQCGVALACGVIAALIWRARPTPGDRVRLGGTIVVGLGLATLLFFSARVAWLVTRINDRSPAYTEIGPYVESKLPADAVLLVEERKKLERTSVMFATGRNAYAVTPDTIADTAVAVAARGGKPYLLTHRVLPQSTVFESVRDDRRLYELRVSSAPRPAPRPIPNLLDPNRPAPATVPATIPATMPATISAMETRPGLR